METMLKPFLGAGYINSVILTERNIPYIGNLVYKNIMDQTMPMMVLNLDEDTTLEETFPDRVQSATMLLPPPSAVIKEIEGDREGFIQEYFTYLQTECSEFALVMINAMRMDRELILTLPQETTEDAIWVQILKDYFIRNYGICIGTFVIDEIDQPDGSYCTNINWQKSIPFNFDQSFTWKLVMELFMMNLADIYTVITYAPGYDLLMLNPIPEFIDKFRYDFCALMPGFIGDPLVAFTNMKMNSVYGKQFKPAVTFVQR